MHAPRTSHATCNATPASVVSLAHPPHDFLVTFLLLGLFETFACNVTGLLITLSIRKVIHDVIQIIFVHVSINIVVIIILLLRDGETKIFEAHNALLLLLFFGFALD